MSRGVFVTGTDTGVGKTLAACALIHALRARGLRAIPMKPIALALHIEPFPKAATMRRGMEDVIPAVTAETPFMRDPPRGTNG